MKDPHVMSGVATPDPSDTDWGDIAGEAATSNSAPISNIRSAKDLSVWREGRGRDDPRREEQPQIVQPVVDGSECIDLPTFVAADFVNKIDITGGPSRCSWILFNWSPVPCFMSLIAFRTHASSPAATK